MSKGQYAMSKTDTALADKKRGFVYNKILCALLFVLSGLVWALFFSKTTSPLYTDVGYDSAMFQTIGKYWAQGYLPYVDLFDHKGPLIFFINAVGYALCGRTGVFILELLTLALSEWLAFEMLKEAKLPRIAALAAAAFLPFFIAMNWQEGNTTEEYILPLLFASYLLMLRWCAAAERGNFRHPARFAFVYGLTFAFALLTRVTNALGLCLGVAFIVIALIAKREWKNLFANAGMFILGSAVLILPFCIYFAAHGALYDMWYGTLLFNLDYKSNSATVFGGSLIDLVVLFRRYIVGWCLVAAALWRLIADGRGRRLVALFWLIIGTVSTVFMYTLYDYAHYGVILLPLFYVALALFFRPQEAARKRRVSMALAVCMLVIVGASSALKVYKDKTEVLPPQAYEDYADNYLPLIELIPEDGRESFIAFDCPRRIYLETGLRPSLRFFTLQQWMCVNSSSFAEALRTEFDESSIEWVLTFSIYSEPLAAADIIEAKYSLVAQSENGIYKLYHLDIDSAAEGVDAADAASAESCAAIEAEAALPEDTEPGKVIYLTFDDGPCNNTVRLLETLDKYDAKATFFVITGKNKNLATLADIAKAGHAIGIHADCHCYGTLYAGHDVYIEDLKTARELIYDETGQYPDICRFPGGSTTASHMLNSREKDSWEKVKSTLCDMGIRYYDWNVQIENSASSAESLYYNFIKQVEDCDTPIVLQHDTRLYSVKAVEKLLKWGTENGYSFRALDSSVAGCQKN